MAKIGSKNQATKPGEKPTKYSMNIYENIHNGVYFIRRVVCGRWALALIQHKHVHAWSRFFLSALNTFMTLI